ncbi:MAG: hydrolase, partial [Rubrivivax sp.]|nr:hydrolase [Rubrivivax sp.]
MRMASWRWGGTHHAGTVSPCGREVTPLAVPQPERGVLRLIQLLARGEALPRAAGPRLPVEAVELCAPLPRPLRSLFCVGRNYRSHAAELASTVFRDSLPKEDAWPPVFMKFAECVV